MKTSNETLVSALRILSKDIQSEDGIANACIAEAADRIEELAAKISEYEVFIKNCFRFFGEGN
jgi:hypothetical protein